jgi:hypothetical protein
MHGHAWIHGLSELDSLGIRGYRDLMHNRRRDRPAVSKLGADGE